MDNDAIQQEIMALLNQEDILSSLNTIFQKYGVLDTKNISIEFNFFEKTSSDRDCRPNSSVLPAPSPDSVFRTTAWFCPCPPNQACAPPPGKWIG
ncbi:MAG: hypothetical protein N4J56_005680 [Chroococcidiopsis sp. SAG 2025]|uniref:hypothetical protein n=1 Tax=Chroococcidiopsis sp. SAG 2025 TaxID=171389 RepID=UPI0029370DC2|nr:hypothetical protein [Chroococcidiopsis sp. SAG 2025]MDV2996026.1 hypothetical protein [Chroococcidiopsis sp. SAG 2025]